MTQPDTLHTRLRDEIDRRLAVARAATPGLWWDSPVLAAPGNHTIRGGPNRRRGFDESLGGDTRPVARIEPAPDYQGEFVTNHDADAVHIALHDPADAIRRYEGELEVLERHAPEGGDCRHCLEGESQPRHEDWPCPEITSLAHRLGVSVDA